MDGHRWTYGGRSSGPTQNVHVDASGHLHLAIARIGRRATAAELFSNDDMGFGTYRWQIEGPLDRLDPHAVLGLFPYGPEHGIGVDGENEIDVEFSRWADTLCGGGCNADFTISWSPIMACGRRGGGWSPARYVSVDGHGRSSRAAAV